MYTRKIIGFPEELYKQIVEEAKKSGSSFSEEIRIMASAYLDFVKKEKDKKNVQPNQDVRE